MIKALQEHGYNFDILGGTSAGSAMAALCALGYSPDDALIQLEEMFINKKSFRKYSIPFYSFIDHKNFDSELKRVAAKIDIENPPINYFAVATNISRNQLQVIHKGPVWEAVRSSCSIPGVLPPFITKDGDVLIDGAVMDNTPIETLRSIKSGPNIVMNFTPLRAWKVNSDYSTIPRGFELLRKVILPKRKNRKYYPTIFAILSRAMITNTEKRFSEIDQKDDIFLEPKRLSRMGMMNWKRSREQFELSYKQMKTALASTEAQTEQEKIIVLRNIANNMKQRKSQSTNSQ
ncbi:MAG: NTE family protein [Cocleimonas sp.]|jgi:NTE family protein